ncbi:MAG: alpha/beta hydrolase [Oscillospiraceae bacterium]|nr:alpha/beta hydrolase [Oscillospiraceae bacterium]
MKTFLKIVCVFLALILIVAAVFWFCCRVIEHRSFMAGFVDTFLRIQHRNEKFLSAEAADAYIARKAVSNAEPVVISGAKFGVSLREESSGALQAFIYNDQEHPAQTVFYFHGGAYVNQPNSQQTTMAARTAKETGCKVVLMVYPKEPVYNCETACEQCLAYFKEHIEKYDCGKIVFMGDSAGGGLALGLAELLHAGNYPEPEELILISPWADVSMTNPDMPEYLKKDPMLGIDGCRRMGEVWADGLPLTDPRVSPLYGDVSGLCHVTMTVGTWEVLYPDILLLYEKFKDAGVDCELITGERMIHCWPICPIPEAKAAQSAIWAAILK